MKKTFCWLAWLIAIALFALFNAIPLRTGTTRAIILSSLGLLLFGLLFLIWDRSWARILILSAMAVSVIFLLLPSKGLVDKDELREIYLRRLVRYDKTPYVYGGETGRGIDCSGLVRRGMIDALFIYGARKLDPGALRASFYLWWHDSNAVGLGQPQGGTNTLTKGTSNRLSDDGAILPGDLAITASGSHVIAYLGQHTWIEADPAVGRTHIFTLTGPFRSLSDEQVKFVRWSWLGKPGEQPH